jgi:hypothetical protein
MKRVLVRFPTTKHNAATETRVLLELHTAALGARPELGGIRFLKRSAKN